MSTENQSRGKTAWSSPTFEPESAVLRAATPEKAVDVALATRIATLEAALAASEARRRALEEQNNNLVLVNVATQLLSLAQEREDVLCAIEEIVVNMVGSEEVAVLEHEPGEGLVLVRARGIDAQHPRFVRAAATIERAATSGDLVVPASQHLMTAAVPMKVDTNVVGVIAIFRLLSQKPSLEPVDHDLFELLSRHGAIAMLYSAAFKHVRPTVRPPKVLGSNYPSHGILAGR